jgi:hypothetical protein
LLKEKEENKNLGVNLKEKQEKNFKGLNEPFSFAIEAARFCVLVMTLE